MFCRYDLRTTDPTAALAFYTEVLGLDFADASVLGVWPLHEQARARGAPAHWLGQIGVSDLDATLQLMIEHASERLGPAARSSDDTPFAVVRDNTGAVVGLRGTSARPARVPVAWHHLHTRDLDQSWKLYSELFGWTEKETLDVADPVGGYRMFSWPGAAESIGSMANTARRPGVHPHWMFYFPVADIDEAMAKVRAQGGQVSAAATTLPDASRIVPCEDGQGAAFGLYQSALHVGIGTP